MFAFSQLCVAARATTNWTVVPLWNAVPTGAPTTEDSLDACLATCTGDCDQFAFNLKSKHCYLSAAADWAGVASDHVTSGCDASRVSKCAAPTPSPPAPPAGPPAVWGAPWFSNRKATNLSVSADALTWSPLDKPDTLVTYLPTPLSLAKDGDTATLRTMWTSDGIDSCPASDWEDHKFCKDDEPCMHTSVHCLAGTGDFRIGLLDSAGAGKVAGAGWADTTSYSGVDHALSSPPFSGYRGYSFRIFPHVSTKAERYTPKESGSTAVPCSFNWNGLTHPKMALSKERLAYNGCFEAPAGRPTELKLEIHRVSKSETKLTMAMGDVSYSHTHHLAKDEESRLPTKVDTFLIEYPNSRKYSYVTMAPPATA
jgi:hypothetical protein